VSWAAIERIVFDSVGFNPSLSILSARCVLRAVKTGRIRFKLDFYDRLFYFKSTKWQGLWNDAEIHWRFGHRAHQRAKVSRKMYLIDDTLQ
jgi:hypothetical protein